MTRDTPSVGPGWWESLSSGTRQRIEEATAAEQASCVVRPATRDYSQWWAQIDAQRQAAPRLRLVREPIEARQ